MRFILLFAAGFSVATFANAQAPVPVLVSANQYQYQNVVSGATAFTAVFETATPFQNGFAVVSNDHKYQVITSLGQPVSDARWAEISPTANGYALAFGKNGDRALLQGGKIVFQTKARLLGSPAPDGTVLFLQPETGKMGLLNVNTGKEALSAQFDHLRPFSEGLAAALVGSAWKFVDVSGKPISAQQYEGANAFSGGLAAVRRHGKWGFINKKEDWTIPAQYDQVTDFQNGNAFAQTGDTWKQISNTGTVLRELPYQMIITPTEGLYAFMQNNLWGYASAETGEVVIAPKYLRAASFVNGLAFVAKDGVQFYIQPDGTELRVVK